MTVNSTVHRMQTTAAVLITQFGQWLQNQPYLVREYEGTHGAAMEAVGKRHEF